MDLPAGTGAALNIRILFGFSCLKDRSNLPAIHPWVLFITNISILRNTGKSGRVTCRFAWKSHRWTASWAELLWQRDAHPATSSFPKFHRGLNRQKWIWGDVENWWWALFIFWSPRQSDWRLLLSDSCLADARWAVRRALLPKGGMVSALALRLSVGRAALIRFYIWAGDNKTTVWGSSDHCCPILCLFSWVTACSGGP